MNTHNIINLTTSIHKKNKIEHNTKCLQKWLKNRKNKTEFEEKALEVSDVKIGTTLSVIFAFVCMFVVSFLTFKFISKYEDTEAAILLCFLPNIIILPVFWAITRPLFNLFQKDWFCFIFKVSKYLKSEAKVRNIRQYEVIKNGETKPVEINLKNSLNFDDIFFADHFLLLAENEENFEEKWNEIEVPSYFTHELKVTTIGLLVAFAIAGGIFCFTLYCPNEAYFITHLEFPEPREEPSSIPEFIESVKKARQDMDDIEKYGHSRTDLDKRINGEGMSKNEIVEKMKSSKEGDIYCYYFEEQTEYATKAVFVYCTKEDSLPAVIVTKKEGEWYFVQYEVPKTKQFGEKEQIISNGERL